MDINVLEKNFLGCTAPLEEATVVMVGVPYDGTVSFRSGTRMAPGLIRKDSIGIESYSPYQGTELTNHLIHDAGDLDLPFGNTVKALTIIEKTVEKIISLKKKSFLIGGEHLISYPAVKAMQKAYPELCVIHFDAHADLRDEYLGEKLSHATVMRRMWDILGDEHIWQLGIRSGSKEEFLWSEEGHTKMERFNVLTIEQVINEIGSRPVYITLDLDVLDTSVFPGTGTPDPGGLFFNDLLSALLRINELNIVGADIVELAPHYDISGASTAVACKIIREMLLLMCA